MSEPEDLSRTVTAPLATTQRSGPAATGSGNALTPGTRLEEFEVVALIGEGGFGIVYLAHDHLLNRDVALKEYMPADMACRLDGLSVGVKFTSDGETYAAGLRSFINEARLLARFNHPALVKVHRFWEANGTAYMVMPYCPGDTLKNTLDRAEAAPDEDWLKRLLGALIEGLALMHADRCYHRDISPDNILIDEQGAPLLLDFGAARRVIGDRTQALTVILKPGYAPIEQYGNSLDVEQGPWTDVYALACVAYYAIARQKPPAAASRVVNDRLEPLAQRAAGRYSAPFLRAIDRAMSLRPEDRPATVQAFAQELGLGDAVRFTTSAPPAARTAPAPASRAAPAAAAPIAVPSARTPPAPAPRPAVAAAPPPRVAAPPRAATTRTEPLTPAPATSLARLRRQALWIGGAAAALAGIGIVWTLNGGTSTDRREPAPAASVPTSTPPPAVAQRPVAPPPAPASVPTQLDVAAPAPAPTASAVTSPARPAVSSAPAITKTSRPTAPAVVDAPIVPTPKLARETPPAAAARPASRATVAAPKESVDNSRCADIVLRSSLGEALSAADQALLNGRCAR